MSRELLKRALDALNGRCPVLRSEIETELAKPEPEPVAYEYTSTCGNKFATHTPPQYARNIRPLYATPPDQSARIAELEAELAQAYKIVDENWVCHQELAALQSKREILSRLKPIGYIPAYAARIIHNEGSWDAFHLYRTQTDPTDVEVYL